MTGDETSEVPPEVKPVVPTPTSPLLTSLLKSPSPAPTAQVDVTALCFVRQSWSDMATMQNTEANTGLFICVHTVVRMFAFVRRYLVQVSVGGWNPSVMLGFSCNYCPGRKSFKL